MTTATQHDKSFDLENVFLGRTAEGERVYVDVTIGWHPQSSSHHETHEPVEGYYRVSFMGSVVEKGRKTDNPSRCGQCDEALLEVVEPASGWSLREIKRVHELWQRWHLNDLKAGCAHQTVVWEDGQYGHRPSLELTEPCPVSGYKYGHAWLVEPATDEVLDEIRALFLDR